MVLLCIWLVVLQRLYSLSEASNIAFPFSNPHLVLFKNSTLTWNIQKIWRIQGYFLFKDHTEMKQYDDNVSVLLIGASTESKWCEFKFHEVCGGNPGVYKPQDDIEVCKCYKKEKVYTGNKLYPQGTDFFRFFIWKKFSLEDSQKTLQVVLKHSSNGSELRFVPKTPGSNRLPVTYRAFASVAGRPKVVLSNQVFNTTVVRLAIGESVRLTVELGPVESPPSVTPGYIMVVTMPPDHATRVIGYTAGVTITPPHGRLTEVKLTLSTNAGQTGFFTFLTLVTPPPPRLTSNLPLAKEGDDVDLSCVTSLEEENGTNGITHGYTFHFQSNGEFYTNSTSGNVTVPGASIGPAEAWFTCTVTAAVTRGTEIQAARGSKKLHVKLLDDRATSLVSNTLLLREPRKCPNSAPGKYVGNVSSTQRGVTCQNWVHNYPRNLWLFTYYYRFGFLGNAAPNNNHCRDPNLIGVPWCFTTDLDRRWDICFPQHCKVEMVTSTTSTTTEVRTSPETATTPERRKEEPQSDNMPLVIGLASGGGVLVLLLLVMLYILRKKWSKCCGSGHGVVGQDGGPPSISARGEEMDLPGAGTQGQEAAILDPQVPPVE